jgi:hypothetical protein
MKSIITVILALTICGCDFIQIGCGKTSHNFINVKNNSFKDFYFTNKLELNDNLTIPSKKLKINSQVQYFTNRNGCLEKTLKNKNVINFYFYDAEILESNKWEDVVKNNLGILDSIKVDLAYLQKNNWTVTYPK